MTDKTISPGQEDASATPQAPDDTTPQDAAELLFGGTPQEEPEEEPKEEPKEQEEEQQPEEEVSESEEDDDAEPFATFGNRTFESKEDLLEFTKKVHGDNSRLVGDIKSLESRIKGLETAKSEHDDQPSSKTASELSESERAVEEAKDTLRKTLLEMGFVQKEQLDENLSPILQERIEKQAEELKGFVNEHPDFWDYETEIRSLDGQINPITGKNYTAQEAYSVVKYLKNPDISKGYDKGKEDAKKQIAKRKQAAISSKETKGTSEKGEPQDILDTLLATKV